MEKGNLQNQTNRLGKLKKKYLLQIFKILTSLVILFLLFNKINISLHQLISVLLSINLGYLFISMIGVILVLWIKSYRWLLILKSQGYSYNPLRAFKVYMSSFTIGIITPGRLGEFTKVYNLRNDIEINSGTAFMTVICDRMFDFFFLFGFALSGVFIIFMKVDQRYSYLVIILILFFLYLLTSAVNFAIKKIIRKRTNSRSRILKFICKSLQITINRKSHVFWLITLFAYIFYFLSIQFLLYSLNIRIAFVNTAFIISLVGLFLLLPISIAGFGTREVSLVFLLSFFNISSELAITFSLLQFSVFFVWAGLIGLIFWFLNPISLDILKNDYRMFILKKNKPS